MAKRKSRDGKRSSILTSRKRSKIYPSTSNASEDAVSGFSENELSYSEEDSSEEIDSLVEMFLSHSIEKKDTPQNMNKPSTDTSTYTTIEREQPVNLTREEENLPNMNKPSTSKTISSKQECQLQLGPSHSLSESGNTIDRSNRCSLDFFIPRIENLLKIVLNSATKKVNLPNINKPSTSTGTWIISSKEQELQLQMRPSHPESDSGNAQNIELSNVCTLEFLICQIQNTLKVAFNTATEQVNLPYLDKSSNRCTSDLSTSIVDLYVFILNLAREGDLSNLNKLCTGAQTICVENEECGLDMLPFSLTSVNKPITGADSQTISTKEQDGIFQMLPLNPASESENLQNMSKPSTSAGPVVAFGNKHEPLKQVILSDPSLKNNLMDISEQKTSPQKLECREQKLNSNSSSEIPNLINMEEPSTSADPSIACGNGNDDLAQVVWSSLEVLKNVLMKICEEND